jgi:hypothetical protein
MGPNQLTGDRQGQGLEIFHQARLEAGFLQHGFDGLWTSGVDSILDPFQVPLQDMNGRPQLMNHIRGQVQAPLVRHAYKGFAERGKLAAALFGNPDGEITLRHPFCR